MRLRLPVPVEIRPHICTALAASLANELTLNAGQAEVIGPAVAADGDRVTGAIIGAVHEQPARAHVARLSEGDFLPVVGHAPAAIVSGDQIAVCGTIGPH